jgi:hypothetical protein
MIQLEVVGTISDGSGASTFCANPRNLMGFLVSFKAVVTRKQAYARH